LAHTSPLTASRIADLADAPNGPQAFSNMVLDLEDNTVPRFATASARDSAYTAWIGAGNSWSSGLLCFTQNDGRYWRYDVASTGWKYAGGNPPPIAAVTAGSGWSTMSRAPGVYLDSSGLAHLVGGVYPQSGYNPQDGGTHTAFTLPTGYRPGANVEAIMSIPSPVLTTVLVEIRTDGVGYIIAGSTSSIPSGTNSAHFLDNITFHPGYAGSTPVS
jgi:hypothetical protein